MFLKVERSKYLQFWFLIFLLIPSFQYAGFIFINLKVLIFTVGIVVLVLLDVINKKSIKANYLIILFCVFLIFFWLAIAFLSLLEGSINGYLYFYIKIICGFLVCYYIKNSSEELSVKLWEKIFIISAAIALFQQLPVFRPLFMSVWGSVQGLNSDWPYSRSGGLTSHFYVYTQFMVLVLMTLRLQCTYTFKKNIFLYSSTLFCNTRSTVIIPLIHLFLLSNLRLKVLLLVSFFAIFTYMVDFYSPIKVIYSHLFEVVSNFSLEPILKSKYSSFSQRVTDVFNFFDILKNEPLKIWLTGFGSKVALGQEVGFFFIVISVGIIGAFLYYLTPVIFLFIYLKFEQALNYLIYLIPIYLTELFVTGFVKFELYIMFWVFVGFAIKKRGYN